MKYFFRTLEWNVLAKGMNRRNLCATGRLIACRRNCADVVFIHMLARLAIWFAVFGQCAGSGLFGACITDCCGGGPEARRTAPKPVKSCCQPASSPCDASPCGSTPCGSSPCGEKPKPARKPCGKTSPHDCGGCPLTFCKCCPLVVAGLTVRDAARHEHHAAERWWLGFVPAADDVALPSPSGAWPIDSVFGRFRSGAPPRSQLGVWLK